MKKLLEYLGLSPLAVTQYALNQGLPPHEAVAEVREWLKQAYEADTPLTTIPPKTIQPINRVPLDRLDQPDLRAWLGDPEDAIAFVDEQLSHQRAVEQILAFLPPWKSDLFKHKYGVGEEDQPRTYDQVGELYGVSGQSVRYHVIMAFQPIRDHSKVRYDGNPLFGIRDALD